MNLKSFTSKASITSHSTGYYSFSPDKLVVGYCATGNVNEGSNIGRTIITNTLSANSGFREF